ncbi:thioesterase II family protein [Micromonospora tulbaghiae]|uniref:Thioesterase n=1 Tax=Micromonospora tulbaghiae TaxID=479978 RepID=A0AAW4JB11_9ACTN|nr:MULTISPECIES: alpha/beta fold hydrolase [Micromonospora]KAB1910363.1 thioesterase [Micromonospora sp. AMSO1212t]MBO4139082.1 thioesterase [Micromonospora tulbaghiae]
MSQDWFGARGLRDPAPVRLFCLAHAGGGGSFFRSWRELLTPDVAVVPVILPGRESRSRERPYRRMADLVEALAASLTPHLDRPFALFGHSMGAAVAFETAHLLARGNGPRPRRLFVSGRRPPTMPSRRPDLHRLPDDQFIDAVARMGGTPPELLRRRELLDVFLPRLRADFEVNETYQPGPRTRLSCPVSAFTGDTDPEVDALEMAAWQSVTDGEFVLRVFRGGHFYLVDAAVPLTRVILAELQATPVGP